jgi:hypothetical protein
LAADAARTCLGRRIEFLQSMDTESQQMSALDSIKKADATHILLLPKENYVRQ